MTAHAPAGTLKRQKLWTKSFWLICLSNISVYLTFHSLQPTLPIYIENMGGSKSIIGLALAVVTLAAVIVRPFTGWALDNYGRRVILALGLLIFLGTTLSFSLMLGIVPLLLLRLVQGFGWGILNTSEATVASDIIPKEQMGRGLGIYGMTISLSLAVAPIIGLWLVDYFSFRFFFLAGAGFTLASLLFAMSIRYPKKQSVPSKTKLVFYEKMALRPSAVTLLMTITYASFPSFLALFVNQRGLASAGWFFTAMALTTLLSRPFSGSYVDKKGRRGYDQIVFLGLILIMLSMLVLSVLTASWLLVLSGILFGLGYGGLQPTMLALAINSCPPERRGAANATYWTAFDIGVAVGSVMWGIVANYYGYAIMFGLNAVPPVLGILVYWFSRSKVTPEAA